MCDNKGGFFLFCRQIGRCKATAGEERGVFCLFSLQLSCFCFVIVFFYRLLICFPLYLAFLFVFATCYKTSKYPVVRQISNLFRIMKSVVWRQKSNMIKKQDSSFSYRNHIGLTPETSWPHPRNEWTHPRNQLAPPPAPPP